jgi:trk system potassium uptake protein TrkH
MCIGAINFNLHYFAFHQRRLSVFFRNAEWRGFVVFCVLSCAIVYIALLLYGSRNYPAVNLLDVCFDTLSILTTTGFISKDISLWPGFVPLFIMFTCVIGGCTGSTGGGLKVMRALLLQKQGLREIKRLIHPREISVIHLGKTLLSNRVVEAIWGFFVIYCVIFTLLLLLLLAANEDFFTAYTALIGCFTNAGRGLGGVSASFSPLSPFSLWVLSAAMLLGRLEIFTFLVLFSPAFWRR